MWIPTPMPADPFPSYGFDPDPSNYLPNGYAAGQGVPPMQCSTWMDRNPPPDDCSAAVQVPSVSPSDPPCGPDGSWVSSFIPQNMASACVVHDVCYSQLDANKDSCDNAFRQNLAIVCEEQHPLWWMMTDPGFAMCMSQRDAYYLAVRMPWAQDRFDDLQSDAQCRQWQSRRANESDCR